jgi:hypothetical protein
MESSLQELQNKFQKCEVLIEAVEAKLEFSTITNELLGACANTKQDVEDQGNHIAAQIKSQQVILSSYPA